MKILFIQKNLFPYFGVMSLCGYLRQSHHSCSVLIDTQVQKKDFLKKIAEFNPDIIGFSLMSSEHLWLKEKAGYLKEKFPKTPIIAGGVHAIIYSEAVAAIPGVDYVCYGEGELTLLQLLAALESNSSLEKVGGIFFKENGKTKSTGLNSLITLGAFNEDRSVYYNEYKRGR